MQLTRRSYFMTGGAVLALLVMVAATSPATPAPAAAARETITINQGDTITWIPSVRTDSILKVAGPNKVTGVTCGQSMAFGRFWFAGKALNGDSVTVNVINCKPAGTSSVVLYNDAVLDTVNGVATSRLIWNGAKRIGDLFCILSVRHENGVLVVGAPVTYTSSNPAVATITNSPGCPPDTTVDPAKVPYPFPRPIALPGAQLQRIGDR